jgi:hypothetical protein
MKENNEKKMKNEDEIEEEGPPSCQDPEIL